MSKLYLIECVKKELESCYGWSVAMNKVINGKDWFLTFDPANNRIVVCQGSESHFFIKISKKDVMPLCNEINERINVRANMVTVRDWMHRAAWNEQRKVLDKIGNVRVVDVFDGHYTAFPQTHWNYRNVHHWVLLEDGRAVGWNESPRSGWSFPILGKKTVDKNIK